MSKTSPKNEDFLLLLRKLSTYRGLRVRFRTLGTPSAGASLFGLSPLLNLCLERMHTAEWQQFVSGEITKIVPRCSTKKVGVYIRPGNASSRRGNERSEFERDVLGKIGLDEGVSWSAIVKYEKRVFIEPAWNLFGIG
jgi:hypothetical protein